MSTSRPLRRVARLAALSALLVVPVIAAAASATHAAVPEADLEATILQISGPALTGGSKIAVGRTLSPVQLVVSDPETGNGDALGLIARNTFLRTPAEAATFRIGGAVVATSVPDLFAVSLQTDAGALSGVVITANRVSYFIPRLNVQVATATRTIASSTVGTGFIASLLTYQYGLFPVGAVQRTGPTFQEIRGFGGLPFESKGVAPYRVYDADDLRGSSDARGEELVLAVRNGQPAPSYLPLPGQEVSATVSLRSGAVVTVRGIEFLATGAYGYAERNWMFDQAALAAAGGTMSDIASVLAVTHVDHDLTWSQLGFTG